MRELDTVKEPVDIGVGCSGVQPAEELIQQGCSIVIGVIVGIQTRVDRRLRAWASWLAVAGVILYPIRDLVSFWCRWFAVSTPSSVIYPIKITGGVAMFVALLLALIVFVQGARQADAR